KTALAKGEVGIREKKPAPTLLLQAIWLFRLRPAGRNGGSRSGLVDGSINKPGTGLYGRLHRASRALHICVEDTRTNLAMTPHVHKQPIVAGLRKGIRK